MMGSSPLDSRDRTFLSGNMNKISAVSKNSRVLLLNAVSAKVFIAAMNAPLKSLFSEARAGRSLKSWDSMTKPLKMKPTS